MRVKKERENGVWKRLRKVKEEAEERREKDNSLLRNRRNKDKLKQKNRVEGKLIVWPYGPTISNI